MSTDKTKSTGNDDTESKLAILTSIFPSYTLDSLLDVLISCNGDILQTKTLLNGADLRGSSDKPSGNTSSGTSATTEQEIKPTIASTQITLKRFFRDCEGTDSKTSAFVIKKQRLETKGKPLHLYDPDNVRSLLPCTLHFGVFPKELADRLLTTMLKESETWEENKFNMFDRDVSSPHTTSVYTDSAAIFANKMASYNGKRIENIHMFNADMSEAKRIVEHIVNSEISKRGLMPYQCPTRWYSDMAVCNKYSGPKQSVGFHSDQLTHIGPHAVIASISLGVTREFRFKNRDPSKTYAPISIHLPHNSLIIMHAGCQENYKHALMPCPLSSVMTDTHPIAGLARINITYRMYLPSFTSEKNPKCECQRPMILRVCNPINDAAAATGKDKLMPRYMWVCGLTYTGGKKCSKVEFPKFPVNKSLEFSYP
jgi:hypothetical protein